MSEDEQDAYIEKARRLREQHVAGSGGSSSSGGGRGEGHTASTAVSGDAANTASGSQGGKQEGEQGPMQEQESDAPLPALSNRSSTGSAYTPRPVPVPLHPCVPVPCLLCDLRIVLSFYVTTPPFVG